MEALQVESIAQRYHILPQAVYDLPADTLLHINLAMLGQEAMSGGE